VTGTIPAMMARALHEGTATRTPDQERLANTDARGIDRDRLRRRLKQLPRPSRRT
jgi:hypothetical protein